MKRGTLFFPVLALILFCLAGCATVENTLTYFGFGKPDARYRISNEDVVDFVSRVKPVEGNPDSHYLLATYYLERGLYKEALAEFRKVIAISPDYVKAYNGMGISYDHLEDHGRAVEAFQTALKLDPRSTFIYNNLGYSYMLQGNLDAAISAFEAVIAFRGGNNRIHNNLGMAYALKGEYDRALEQFELAGGKVQAYYNLAQIYFQKGMINEARNGYREALSRESSLGRAQVGLENCDILALAEEKVQNTRMTASSAEPWECATDLKKARIEISNGNGVRNMARRVGNYLGKKGFGIVRLTNADHFNYRRAGVYCQEGYLDVARQVAAEIPGVEIVRPIDPSERSDIHVKVLVGKDLIPHKRLFAGGQS